LKYQDYLTLYRLARSRLDSVTAYQAFQRFQGELLVRYLTDQGVPIAGRSVLDLGSGLGGYSQALLDHGAQILGLDLAPEKIDGSLPLIRADASRVPLAEARFDLVICASLIEHLASPQDLLDEIWRLLRPGGMLYLSFPPFYTPIGGHQFSPYHLLGERIALRIARARHMYKDKGWLQESYPAAPASFSEAWGAWGLYPLTIGRVERILKSADWEIMDRSTRWLPVDLSGLPFLREFLTWHVQFLCRKPDPSAL
jgi:SAM-dependent methyltransferase